MSVYEILNFFGSLVCHQIPDRTIFLNGMPLPVCARDTGIYLGIFSCLCFITVKGRWDSDKPPGFKYALVICLMTLPMMVDGVSSYLGLRESNNFIRIITGGMFGLAVPIFLVGLLNFKTDKPNNKEILESWTEIIILAAAVLLLAVFVYEGILLPWWLVSIMIIGSMLAIFYRLVLTVVSNIAFSSTFYRNVTAIIVLCVILAVLFSANRFIG